VAAKVEPDVVDRVVEDVAGLYPGIDAGGLPIVGRVLRLAQLLLARREEQLAEFGLTAADFDVLATLRRRGGTGPVNVRDLQRAMMLSSSGITKRLDRLERAQLLARRSDPTDRRGVLIALTESGIEIIDAAIPAVSEAEAEIVRSAVSNERDRSRTEAALRELLLAQQPT
jgi:DNA-binding MarR family transcriptional regulator